LWRSWVVVAAELVLEALGAIVVIQEFDEGVIPWPWPTWSITRIRDAEMSFRATATKAARLDKKLFTHGLVAVIGIFKGSGSHSHKDTISTTIVTKSRRMGAQTNDGGCVARKRVPTAVF
jgi:hypothetical protein